MAVIFTRLASKSDIPEIMAVVTEAKKLLKSEGNEQWPENYPNAEIFTEDIEKNYCYVLIVGHTIAGVATLWQEGDAPYENLIDGEWQNPSAPYSTIHRVAISSEFRGQNLTGILFSHLFSYSYENGFHNVRIDTHDYNKRMQHIMKKNGFEYRGKIIVDDTGKHEYSERLGFELNLPEPKDDRH